MPDTITLKLNAGQITSLLDALEIASAHFKDEIERLDLADPAETLRGLRDLKKDCDELDAYLKRAATDDKKVTAPRKKGAPLRATG